MTERQKSKLLPIGVVFILIGLILPFVTYKLAWSLEFEGESTMAILLIVAGVLALLLPVGIILAIVGFIKNRKAAREAAP